MNETIMIMGLAKKVLVCVQDMLDDSIGKKAVAEVKTITKNNVERLGISIDEGVGIAPVYYIDGILEDMLDDDEDEGDMDDKIYEIAAEIFDTYCSRNIPKIDTAVFNDKDFLLGNVTTKIVCSVGNEAMLRNVVHTPIAGTDLEVVYAVALNDDNGEGIGCTVINEKHLQVLEITHDELKDRAIYNLLTGDYYFTAIEDMLFTLNEEGNDNSTKRNCVTLKEDAALPMYVFRSISSYGASSILFGGVLMEIAEKMNDDLIIIPSSVYEVLIVPYSAFDNSLNALIKDINGTEVAPEERLSDHGYIFRRETSTFENL